MTTVAGTLSAGPVGGVVLGGLTITSIVIDKKVREDALQEANVNRVLSGTK